MNNYKSYSFFSFIYNFISVYEKVSLSYFYIFLPKNLLET